MTNKDVFWEKDARGVATITINRPEKNNAYNGAVVDGLASAVVEAAADEDVRLLLFRGEGKHFQAGADLNWLKQTSQGTAQENFDVSYKLGQAVDFLNNLSKPTMALVQGACIGGGTGILAACDVVIAADNAIFAISETRWGLMAAPIIPHLNEAMGSRHVRRYAMSCEKFDAKRAQELGLVHEVCALEDMETTAANVIDGFLKSAPEALADTKSVIMDACGLNLSSSDVRALADIHARKRQSWEAAEGIASFIEKRDPQWYPSSS